MKATLFLLAGNTRGANARIAKALGVDEKEARRILDPHHHTKASTIERAIQAFGKRLVLSFEEITREVR